MNTNQAASSTLKILKMAIPIIIGVFMLVNLLNPVLQKYYSQVFTGSFLIDSLIGAIGGSVSFGIPITSYITGGKLLDEGVSLLAVSSFMLAWTTVGLVMLPMEISFLGKRFAITRNIINFILSILISILTVITLNLL